MSTNTQNGNARRRGPVAGQGVAAWRSRNIDGGGLDYLSTLRQLERCHRF